MSIHSSSAQSSPVDNSPWRKLGIDEASVIAVMRELMARGGEYGDLYFELTHKYEFVMKDGVIALANSIVDLGVGLRVVGAERVGYAYSADLSMSSMLQAAQAAHSIHQCDSKSVPQSFSKVAAQHNLYPSSHPWKDVAVPSRVAPVHALAELAKKVDPAVEKVGVRFVQSDSHILVANSLGHIYEDYRPFASLGLSISARRHGKSQSNSRFLNGRFGLEYFSEASLRQLAQDAVDDTLILFEAVRPRGGELPVVLAAGASGILLHEAVGHGLEADLNRKGTSVYSGLMGKRVGSEQVTIVDDGMIPNASGSINMDDEGVPSQRTVLVEGGVLKSYLHDRISARHYGVPSTGSGRRSSFRSAPLPRMRCTFMENGPYSKAEIIANVKNGILAENFVNGQVNIGSGDFMFYVKNGWIIENGRLTQPVKDISVCGNGPETLKLISMVANDLRIDNGSWECSKEGQRIPVSIGMPTVLVSRMSVGGDRER